MGAKTLSNDKEEEEMTITTPVGILGRAQRILTRLEEPSAASTGIAASSMRRM